MASKFVNQHAPFDVINLDLCDSVTSLAEQGTLPNLEAIRALCDVQIRPPGRPWLFFLTTRAIRDDLDDQTRRKLFKQLIRNIRDNDEFAQSLEADLEIDGADLMRERKADGALDANQWFRAYVLAIAKWLLHYMMAHDYRAFVRMLPSYVYSVQRGVRDMASLAFRLEPDLVARTDESGLTGPQPNEQPAPSETDLARQLVGQVSSIRDVDAVLESDPKLKREMLNKSSDLLRPLGYDMAAYAKFASSK
jgi:hypothetical protein